MKTALAESHYLATPGRSTMVEIEVTNTDEVIDGVTAIVDGINPDWVRLERPVLSLFPETSDRLTVVFDIPLECPAGDYLIVVRILSTIADDRQTIHDFWLTVGVVNGVDVSLRPSIVTGGKRAMFDAMITNTGNAAAAIEVGAIEPTRAVDCRVDPSRFVLGPGAPAVLPIQLRGPRPWFGQPTTRQIHVTAGVGDQVVERIATFNQKPRIPRGLLTALMLAGIILLWALIFLWVIGELRSSEPVAKATGSSFMTGPDNIPLGLIGGTVEGRVTAATTKEGISRITVEALRVTSNEPRAMTGAAGDEQVEPTPTASAATDDDGTFSIPSLIPGDYQLRLSADGYPEAWYTDEHGNRTIEVPPADTLDGLDVVMTGEMGAITGRIALPEGSAQVPLTVTATMVQERATGEEPPTATQMTTDGTVNLAPLPTPATYVVSIAGDGFETQLFEQQVGGGQQSIINTVNLVPEDGVLQGTVVAAGAPLGDVEVVARSGTTELRTTTATTGDDLGTYRLDGLPTPATYVVTFVREGFSSQTKSLLLSAGSTTAVDATLVSGSGTVTGTAVDGDGRPLGGVTVEVTGDDFDGETSTLTTGSAGGAAGSFTISGLPVPGEYTITFKGDDIQNETVGASFDGAGERNVGTVVLLPTSSEVRGTVSLGGGGLGEVQIVLTDGVLSQITTSATNPAGAYAFADVPAGAYTLTFTRAGVARQIVLITVVAGVDTVRDVAMAAG